MASPFSPFLMIVAAADVFVALTTPWLWLATPLGAVAVILVALVVYDWMWPV